MEQTACSQTPITCFDITRAAGAYSQLAGILAAFAFGAIVLLLQSKGIQKALRNNNSGQYLLLGSFFLAFFGCAASTYLFALLSGEQSGAESHMTLVMSYSASIVLSLSIMPLFFGILTLFSFLRLGAVFKAAKSIFLAVLLLVALYMFITIRDMISVVNYQKQLPLFGPGWLGAATILLLTISILAGMILVLFVKETAFSLLLYSSLGLIIFFAFTMGWASENSPGMAWSLALTEITTALFFAIIGLYFGLSLILRVNMKVPDERHNEA